SVAEFKSLIRPSKDILVPPFRINIFFTYHQTEQNAPLLFNKSSVAEFKSLIRPSKDILVPPFKFLYS
ncbi:hypothetical protein V7055_22455, partial [Bacillus thuringiensis]